MVAAAEEVDLVSSPGPVAQLVAGAEFGTRLDLVPCQPRTPIAPLMISNDSTFQVYSCKEKPSRNISCGGQTERIPHRQQHLKSANIPPSAQPGKKQLPFRALGAGLRPRPRSDRRSPEPGIDSTWSGGKWSAVTFPAEMKSRMKIKIRKTIKSKIKNKSTTH